MSKVIDEVTEIQEETTIPRGLERAIFGHFATGKHPLEVYKED